MPRRHPRPPPSAIEKDFLDALERVAGGRPNNVTLKRLAARGRLRVSVSTVAKEAGHSRTLIAYEQCRYPAIRLQILDHKSGRVSTTPRTASAVISSLRADIAALRQDWKKALAEQASHFHARQLAEREAARWKGNYERLKAARTAPSAHGSVVPLKPMEPPRQEP